MTSHPFRIAISAFFFALAIAAVVLVVGRDSGSSASTPASGSGGTVATSAIWKQGDTWTVLVAQDGAAVSPDSTRAVSNVAYRFEVERAPKSAKGEWGVFVTQDGAEGPFADGWHLTYQADAKNCMQLTYVAQGEQKRMEASVASIVLGVGFPYDTSVCTAPAKERTVPQSKLLAQSALPPTALPDGGGSNGVAPPSGAPSVGAGQLPPGVPATA